MKPWLLFLIIFLVSALLTVSIYFAVIITKFYKFVQEVETENIEEMENNHKPLKIGTPDDVGVDVVYTWVNTRDKNWQSLKNKYSNKNIDYDNNDKRWTVTKRPYDEILLSIKSVRKYLPWVKNIYVIAQRPQSLPNWILKQYNVKMVYHDEIFPDNNSLPTFNSIAIETNLHRVPGLSEKFIYFNDDMYINKPIPKKQFFRNNKPIFRYNTSYSLILNVINLKAFKHGNKHYDQLQKTKKLLNNKFLTIIHQATPITKTIMKSAEERYPNEWNRARNTKLRRGNTIVPVYLALNNALTNNGAIILRNDILKHKLVQRSVAGINKTHDIVCVNEIQPNDLNTLYDKILKNK